MVQQDYEYLSPSYKNMFGYEDDELENHPDSWQKLIHPDDYDEVSENLRQHIESKGEVPYDNIARYYHKDGSIVWIFCRGKVIEWDDDGQPVRMVGTHVDITPLKTIEEELYRSNRELEQFAYVASHDLQEPLNTIKDFVNLFVERYQGKLDADADQYLEFIMQAAKRMGSLVKGVLGYSRIGRNTELETVDLNEILKEVQKDLSKSIKETDTDFEVGTLPVMTGYRVELHSLFLNIISNAIKFRKDGRRPKIKISAEEKANHWLFAVADNGIGIEKKNKERIFNIFQRLNNMDSYEGTGIGLAQCKKIVEIHGGRIWVNTTSGEGSTFHFTLKK